jgi:2-oxoglutarate dehydrogenase E1 component
LIQILNRLVTVPDDFQPHRKIKRFLANREEMAERQRPLDWATAEALAFGTLAYEGHRVRLSGQDSGRGTFSQRNGVLHDARGNGQTYVPLQHVAPGQASVELINSPLSEVGVVGFEYGYSLDTPDGLTLWEAQFGDFCNAAQVMIDQFISSAEDKWRRLSGMVLLLPHGFEGQGPEHSSARLERFLALAAEDNIQIAQPTTPAQYYHVLRRQVIRPWRKPLVVMTPKSLLRHPMVISDLDELTEGRFRRVLADERPEDSPEVQRVLLCSGKIYFELAKKREELDRWDVAIIRLEQLYPLEWNRLDRELEQYGKGVPVLWVQEEPENMGAWRYLRVLIGDRLFDRHPFTGIYREASASPATGSAQSHKIEQDAVISLAFAGL